MNLGKALFWLHLATGCLAGTVVLIMSVTGGLLAYCRNCLGRCCDAGLDRALAGLPAPGSMAKALAVNVPH